jgi:hypothetical protein
MCMQNLAPGRALVTSISTPAVSAEAYAYTQPLVFWQEELSSKKEFVAVYLEAQASASAKQTRSLSSRHPTNATQQPLNVQTRLWSRLQSCYNPFKWPLKHLPKYDQIKISFWALVAFRRVPSTMPSLQRCHFQALRGILCQAPPRCCHYRHFQHFPRLLSSHCAMRTPPPCCSSLQPGHQTCTVLRRCGGDQQRLLQGSVGKRPQGCTHLAGRNCMSSQIAHSAMVRTRRCCLKAAAALARPSCVPAWWPRGLRMAADHRRYRLSPRC